MFYFKHAWDELFSFSVRDVQHGPLNKKEKADGCEFSDARMHVSDRLESYDTRRIYNIEYVLIGM